jgi:hypothetical protein
VSRRRRPLEGQRQEIAAIRASGANAGPEKGARLAADLIFKVAIITLFTFSAVLASMLWLRV